MKECQREPHRWGEANQALFDASKEEFVIIDRVRPEGPSFKLLGVITVDMPSASAKRKWHVHTNAAAIGSITARPLYLDFLRTKPEEPAAVGSLASSLKNSSPPRSSRKKR